MFTTPWKLNSYECLEAPAVVSLFYHNVYEEGKQGGFEIIQQGVRLVGNGNLRLGPVPDQWAIRSENGKREVDTATSTLSIACEYASNHLRPDMRSDAWPGNKESVRYTVYLRPDGEALRLIVDLEKPLPSEWVGLTSFSLELVPDAFMGKAFFMDVISGIFPRQFGSALESINGKSPEPEPLGKGKRLVTTPEDTKTRLGFESINGELILLDGRGSAQNGWFIVRGIIPAGVTKNALEWRISPTVNTDWVRSPVICYSQIGYHPRQVKRAVIELGQHALQPQETRLVRILEDGNSEIIKKDNLKLWGEYLCFNYAIFDFSDVTSTGMYRLEYETQVSSPFPIDETVYQRDIWQPTLEYFFPIQMCHMEVQDTYRIWHGACHLGDALQAPINHKHFDSYVQYEETETPYLPLRHIPHLDVGGLHDAGDYDLAAGSQARTTLGLVWTQDAFHPDLDQTTVKKTERKVLMHTPDGIPDIIQQIIHGVENLLSGYRAAGHSFSGIIENNVDRYVLVGDPAVMTDNMVKEDLLENVSDDRWAFTNHDTALEYLVSAALAGASRALSDYEDVLLDGKELKDECLKTAEKIWVNEHLHLPKQAPSSYVPHHPELQDILATVELYLTTGNEQFREHLLAKASLILENIPAIGGAVARVIPTLRDPDFTMRFREGVRVYGEKVAQEARLNPFGVPYSADTWRKQAPIWGVAWSFLQKAVDLYFLNRAFPDLINENVIVSVIGYCLGCHPVSNASLVSGVGPKSLTVAYGINRADWTYIPGGVVSGPALLRPNYPELLDPFPYLWMQKEYVISGAANYIFCVLATDQILNQKE